MGTLRIQGDSYQFFDLFFISFLQMIAPYLVISSKKIRAKLILTKYKSITPRNGRYSVELKAAKEEFSKRFMKA